jgi:hypothetical protein
MNSGALKRQLLAKKYGKGDYCPGQRYEGKAAKDSGSPIKANPYTRGTPEHREWNRGWRYARHQDNTTPKRWKEMEAASDWRLERCICCRAVIHAQRDKFIELSQAHGICNVRDGLEILWVCVKCKEEVAKYTAALAALFKFAPDVEHLHWPNMHALIKKDTQ